MKYKSASSTIAFIITALVVLIGVMKNELLDVEFENIQPTEEVLAMSIEEYNVNTNIDEFINNNINTFKFYADTFEINMDSLKEQIIENNKDNIFNENDIANTGKTYNSLDKNLIDYLFQLESTKPKLFQNKHINGNNYSKNYIYGLLEYYCNIYQDVDYKTLASITYIETGNLNSSYMLSKNNIYGGMSNNGLLSYKNLSYGVLIYAKLMNDKYYHFGLNNIEKISKKFNPGHPEWITNVKSVMSKFSNNNLIASIDELNARL